jgi:murein DD-endopeptidase MepM/ murein hydrolase activator NlpD
LTRDQADNFICDRLSVRRNSSFLFFLLLCFTSSTAWTANNTAAPKSIQVSTSREGEMTRFFVENLEDSEVTVTFDLELKNLKGNFDFPATFVFSPKRKSEAFLLSPVATNGGWHYSYTCRYTIGSCAAKHDNSAIYNLPYAPGAAFKVTQGYNGTYSHTGPEQFAIDWKMPIGSPVHAARDGVVVKVKDDSDKGGPDRKYENAANYVLIRHADGTIANYAHLLKGSSSVVLGQKVKAGDRIAASGNSGFSTGPHLHFAVFKTRNGSERESIPVRFHTHTAAATTLAEGQTYVCPDPTGTVAANIPRRATSPKDQSFWPWLKVLPSAQGGSPRRSK